ncbi:MAG: DNA polymerase I [Alphaproteobacteria bacterium]|nr:DNA polymerase I [Alphaproteobacteria bacterium]
MRPSSNKYGSDHQETEQLSLMSYDNGGCNVEVRVGATTISNTEKSAEAGKSLPDSLSSFNSDQKKVAVLIDGTGFVYRAFFALPPLTNAKGKPVGAIYGFFSMLLSLLDKHQADLLCVAFDAGRDTFRKKLYFEYKNNRDETPTELKSQFPLLLEACKAFGLPTVELDGYEADDIIATYADRLASNGYEVRIVSSDKDLTQLISENVYLFDPIKSKVIKKDDVFEKYGVYPENMITLQALMGDKTDNIPGIDGIGPKTAAKLINEFQDIDGLYANIDNVKPIKIQEKLRTNKELLSISKQLVTLCRNAPVPLKTKDLSIKLDFKNAQKFLEEQGFNSLVKRLNKQTERKQKQQRKYIHISCAEEWKTFFELNNPSKIGIFWTACFNNGYALSICTKNQVAFCFFSVDSDKCDKNSITLSDLTQVLQPYFRKSSILKIGYRQCFQLFPDIVEFHDIVSMSYLLNGVAGEKLSAIFPNNENSYICKFSFSEICNSEQACLVSELFFDEFGLMFDQLKNAGLLKIYNSIDLPLLPILDQMEKKGILISSNRLRLVSNILKQKKERLENQIFSTVGYSFNIASPKQLASALFDNLNIPKPNKNASLDIEALEDLREYSSVPSWVIEWRKISKLESTYTDSLCNLIDPIDLRIHTTFRSTSTVTGRLSSSNPNLQNIPYKSELGKQIRSAFISAPGHKLLSFDYSQIELRVLAHLADIKLLKELFLTNTDVHSATAAKVFKVSENQVSPEMRRQAKIINFGIIYGMSAFRLSKTLNVSVHDAKKYIENYFQHFAEFEIYHKSVIEFARSHGYVETLSGRRCYIKDILSKNFTLRQFSERQAFNAVIQGSAADIVKIAMIQLYPNLQELKTSMLVQIHDELVFETEDAFAESASNYIQSVMANCVSLSVPLNVNIKVGECLE